MIQFQENVWTGGRSNRLLVKEKKDGWTDPIS